jgi:hypothetical protein
VFKQHFSFILYRFNATSGFPPAGNGEMTIAAAREPATLIMTSPFDFLTPGDMVRPLEIFVYLSPFKSYLTLSISNENPSEDFFSMRRPKRPLFGLIRVD